MCLSFLRSLQLLTNGPVEISNQGIIYSQRHSSGFYFHDSSMSSLRGREIIICHPDRSKTLVQFLGFSNEDGQARRRHRDIGQHIPELMLSPSAITWPEWPEISWALPSKIKSVFLGQIQMALELHWTIPFTKMFHIVSSILQWWESFRSLLKIQLWLAEPQWISTLWVWGLWF